MKKNNFKIIEGGLLNSTFINNNEFISGYVTNTRLMGVTAMYVHWKLTSNPDLHDLHQFFYFDAEEYGFENYESILGNDEKEIKKIENSILGGLGGEKVSITERESKYLAQTFAKATLDSKQQLPDGMNEYSFMLKDTVILSPSEIKTLLDKECVEIESHYDLINYFLMRCFGKDFYLAKYLTDPSKNINVDLFPEFSPGTFCKNIIDLDDGLNTYLCESLVEADDTYYIIVSNITVDNRLITAYKTVSHFKVTPQEAAFMLSRSEFIVAFEMLCSPEVFDLNSTKLTKTSMVTDHDSGKLYMIFQPHNRHVAKKEYRLNEDVLGMYFVSKAGQLILAAYSLKESRQLEIDLGTSLISRKLIPISKYEFQEPILFEFVQSNFDDFEEFVDAIKTEE